MNEVEKFCKKHEADNEFIEWSKKYKSMKELWEEGDDYEKLVWVATREGMMSEKEHRLFACWCCRQVWQRLNDKNKKAVEVSERYAVGEAEAKELEKAMEGTSGTARGAAYSAAYSAAWHVARDVIGSEKKVGEDEVFEVIREAQVDYLRSNYTLKF